MGLVSKITAHLMTLPQKAIHQYRAKGLWTYKENLYPLYIAINSIKKKVSKKGNQECFANNSSEKVKSVFFNENIRNICIVPLKSHLLLKPFPKGQNATF